LKGYYIDDEDYSDIADLSVPSFVSLDSAEISFQATRKGFIAKAKAAGKTKLIIDVSANGGGSILQDYDLFKQLFPSIDPYGAQQFQAFESTYLLGKKYSEVSDTVPSMLDTTNETLYNVEYDIVSSTFNYATDMDLHGKALPNWEADVRTARACRRQLHEPLPQAPFGYPHSIEQCWNLGGFVRPGTTQAVGGGKGTNDLPMDYIQYLVQTTYAYASPKSKHTTTQPNWATTLAPWCSSVQHSVPHTTSTSETASDKETLRRSISHCSSSTSHKAVGSCIPQE
jgi:hypothetical protein